MTAFDAAAGVVAGIGGPDFGPALMTLLNARCGAGLCSVFTVRGTEVRILAAESHDRTASAFARIASLRYAQRFWRHDIAALSTLGRAHRSVQVLKRPVRGIHDLDYQRECYGEGAVVERLSLYRAGTPAIIANAYRTREAGPFTPADCAAFAEMAVFLHAACARHAELAADRPDPARRFAELASPGLSAREAAVAAMTASGLEAPEIARRLGVGQASVTTYRKRAYNKLGVADRNELRQRLG